MAHAAGLHSGHAAVTSQIDPTWRALGVTLVHSAGFLLVTGVLAVVVYERSAIGVIRRAWVNLDLVWACALIVTALATAVI
jgi:cation transporter-like permease